MSISELIISLASYLKPISEVLLGIFTISGTYLTIKIYRFTQKSETINFLARQILAYNCLEQELLKELSATSRKPIQSLQKEMRQRAAQNEKNLEAIYPDMTPSKARQFIKK